MTRCRVILYAQVGSSVRMDVDALIHFEFTVLNDYVVLLVTDGFELVASW